MNKEIQQEFNYKIFTPEEETQYDKAFEELRKSMELGYTRTEALSSLDIKDSELKRIIEQDFLKALIADMYYSKRKTFEEIAQALDVPLEKIQAVHKEMVQDVANTARSVYLESVEKGSGEA
ncbi:MAG TPA: hypothetical protein VJL89_01310 [Thermodesulfovibrionia bacterium]|nr:hypothetical protein [Thermodesulfovibrionia bacterium]